MKILKYILALFFVFFICQAFADSPFDEEMLARHSCAPSHVNPTRCRISQASISLLENSNNVGYVLHDLTSKESLKGFAKDALTTGLIGPGTRVSGLIPTLTQQLVRHAVKSAVGSAFGEKHAFRRFF